MMVRCKKRIGKGCHKLFKTSCILRRYIANVDRVATRPTIVHNIWQHIKTKRLEYATDKRFCHLDLGLAKICDVQEVSEGPIRISQIQKYLSKHLLPLKPSEIQKYQKKINSSKRPFIIDSESVLHPREENLNKDRTVTKPTTQTAAKSDSPLNPCSSDSAGENESSGTSNLGIFGLPTGEQGSLACFSISQAVSPDEEQALSKKATKDVFVQTDLSKGRVIKITGLGREDTKMDTLTEASSSESGENEESFRALETDTEGSSEGEIGEKPADVTVVNDAVTVTPSQFSLTTCAMGATSVDEELEEIQGAQNALQTIGQAKAQAAGNTTVDVKRWWGCPLQ